MEDNGNDVHLMTEKMAPAFEVQQKQPNRRLPLELECEIYKCLKQPIQRKFIWGMGRGIYEMFGHKLLVKVLFGCRFLQRNSRLFTTCSFPSLQPRRPTIFMCP
jgi:hypothetical protein